MLRSSAHLLCALALVPALAVAACGGDDDSSGGGGGGQSGGATAPSSQRAGGCKQVAQPDAKPNGGAKRPEQALDAGATYDVVLETNCGDITIRLDQKASPRTAASFASLAKSGFFDDTVFHRIVPGFVIQGGDPTGTGTGGPGYSTRDVPPRGVAYTKGVVAMAKTAPDAGLPPDYALLGKVVKGQAVADAIGKLGDPASGEAGTPLQPVVIERAAVREHR